MDIANWLKNGALFSLNKSEILIAYGEVKTSDSPFEKGHSFFVPDFYLSWDQPWCQFEENHILTKPELQELLLESELVKSAPKLDWQAPSQAEFTVNFNGIQSEISKGLINKLVPVIFEVSEERLNVSQLSYFINELLKVNTPQYTYGFWNNESGILGLTPEVLVNNNGISLTSMALAGTDKVVSGKGSLLSNPKEMSEHGFVVSNLNSNLKKYGEVTKSETYEWPINEIKHLRTDISVQLNKSVNSDELIKNLHPTPALGVHPKEYDWTNIKKFETKVNRLRYGAPMAVKLNSGELKSIVAIRNIQWDENSSYIGSGCGIVKESELDKEWDELKLKRRSVKKYLGMEIK